MIPVEQRIAADQQFELLPCVWLDQNSNRCLHYEFRPRACRDFQINSDLCRLSRWDEEAKSAELQCERRHSQ